MKIILINTVLLILAFQSFSQQLEKPSVDRISGDTLQKTSLEKIYSKGSFSGTVGDQLSFLLMKQNGLFSMSIIVQIGGQGLMNIDQGNEMKLKFTDGSVLTLVSATSDQGKYLSPKGCRFIGIYPLSASNISILKAKDIEFIRVNNSSGKELDFEIKEKNRNTILKSVNLIF